MKSHSTLPSPQTTQLPRSIKAFAYATFAVILFSLTVPMTQLAMQEFSPITIAAARTALAGLLALAVILHHRWPLPDKHTLIWLGICGTGIVIGFPYLLGLSLVHVPVVEMGIVLAGMPVITALFATVIQREKHPAGFWIFALLGCALLVFYLMRNLQQLPDFHVSGMMAVVAALLFGGLGYSAGAKAAKRIGGWQTICWTLVLYLPVTLGLFAMQWVKSGGGIAFNAQTLTPLFAVLYLALFSQFWGFRFWYQAMASAGVGRISQLQLLQPFFSLAFISVIFAQRISIGQLFFCLLIAGCVVASMKYAQRN